MYLTLQDRIPYFKHAAENAGWITDTVSGVPPLTLQKAKTNGIQSLTAYGGCSQNGTPTPTNPVPIVCNNGVLKVNSQGQIYADGTTETISLNNNNVATCANLLKVGTYQDTQEIISGNITRNVGVKVLDGTEDWEYGAAFSGYRIGLSSYVQDAGGYCTHFQVLKTNSQSIVSVRIAYGVRFQAVVNDYPTTQDFKDWLAQQYAAGTPVIVVYPLATPVSDPASPQSISNPSGTNTLDIAQASLPNLELACTYKRKR